MQSVLALVAAIGPMTTTRVCGRLVLLLSRQVPYYECACVVLVLVVD